jgi:zinc transporter ZupT
MRIRPRDVGGWACFWGLSIHTILDGVALGAILRAEVGSFFLPGLGVFVAILLHKPLDALSIETMMRLDGWSEKHRGIVNTLFAALCPLAAIIFYLGVQRTDRQRSSGGSRFLCRCFYLYCTRGSSARGSIPQSRSV